MTRLSFVHRLLLIGCGALGSLAGAPSLPGWLMPAMAPAAKAWRVDDPAVVLMNDVTIEYLSHDAVRETRRGAVRIHNATALREARAAVGYDPINDKVISATAYVISRDGKTQRLGRDQFLDHVQTYNRYFWNTRRVLDFSGGDRVPLDGILAWEIAIERHPGFSGHIEFFLPPAVPTFRTSLSASPAPGEALEWTAQDARLQHPRAGTDGGSLRWELDRMRPISVDRPDHFLPNRLPVYVRSEAGQSSTWASFTRQASEIIDPRMDSSGPVKAMAESLAGGKTQKWDRVRALAQWVQSQIVYLAISLDQDNLAGYRPHPAAEILRNRYGDCKDKATLLISMLRAVGEDGHVVLLFSGNPLLVESKWPMAEFNHAIVALPAEGAETSWPVVTAADGTKWVLFDPTDAFTPLGVLPEPDQGGWALILDSSGGSLVRLPMADPLSTRFVRTTRAKLDSLGGLQAAITETGSGLIGAGQHHDRAEKSAELYRQSIEGRLHRTTAAIERLQQQDRWDSDHSTFTVEYSFTSPGFAKRVGSMLLVRPAVVPNSARLKEWNLPARDGVVEQAGSTVEDETRLELPAGFLVEEMPDPWEMSNAAGSAQIEYRVEGRTVVYRCRFQHKGAFYGKADYEALRSLSLALAEQERRPILLRHKAGA
jgi:transglutaminase-like putative cysteine protease